MTDQDVLRAVRTYIEENHLYMRPGFRLGDDESLFENGVVDSMGVMELIAFLESRFVVRVTDDEITEDNLGSLRAIADYVAEKAATEGVA